MHAHSFPACFQRLLLGVDGVGLLLADAVRLELHVKQAVDQLDVGDVGVPSLQPRHGILEGDILRIPLPCDCLHLKPNCNQITTVSIVVLGRPVP